MQLVGPGSLAELGGAMAGVIGLGIGLGFSAHCVAFYSVALMRFVEEGSRG